jgi:FkbM family methyltransferase
VEAKERARSVLSSRGVTVPLRAVASWDALPLDLRRRIYFRLGKKVRQQSRATFGHRFDGNEVRFRLEGTVRELYWVGAYEVDSLPLFLRYARTADVVLDVGAAEGVYSLGAAAVAPEAKVVAAEPGGPQLRRLNGNLELNPRLAERITVLPVALSDRDGTAEFFQLPGGTSSLNPDFRSNAVPRTVEVGRADELVAPLLDGRRLDLVKVDTESTEPEVLGGMVELLEQHRPVIFCEVLAGRTEERLQPLVDQLGYRTWFLSRDREPVRRDRIAGVPGCMNWLFLPDDRVPLQR